MKFYIVKYVFSSNATAFPDALGVLETRSNDQVSVMEAALTGYKLFFSDRPGKGQGGRVFIYIKNTIWVFPYYLLFRG